MSVSRPVDYPVPLFLRLRQAAALPVHGVGLFLVVLVVMAIVIWPARTEQQRRLREALMHGLAGDDWPR